MLQKYFSHQARHPSIPQTAQFVLFSNTTDRCIQIRCSLLKKECFMEECFLTLAGFFPGNSPSVFDSVGF